MMRLFERTSKNILLQNTIKSSVNNFRQLYPILILCSKLLTFSLSFSLSIVFNQRRLSQESSNIITLNIMQVVDALVHVARQVHRTINHLLMLQTLPNFDRTNMALYSD